MAAHSRPSSHRIHLVRDIFSTTAAKPMSTSINLRQTAFQEVPADMGRTTRPGCARPAGTAPLTTRTSSLGDPAWFQGSRQLCAVRCKLARIPVARRYRWLVSCRVLMDCSGYVPSFDPIPPPILSQGSCVSTLRSPVTAFSCGACSSSFIVDTTFSNTGSDTVYPNGVPMIAHQVTILVRWQSSDLSVLAAATVGQQSATGGDGGGTTVSTPASPGGTTSSPTIATTTGTSETSPPSSPGGLSTGAQAGIGVAVGFVVILVLLVVFVFIKRRRRAKSLLPTEVGEGPTELPISLARKAELPDNPPAIPELAGSAASATKNAKELDASEVRPCETERGTKEDRPHLPAQIDLSIALPAELDASPRESRPQEMAADVEKSVAATPRQPLPLVDAEPTATTKDPGGSSSMAVGAATIIDRSGRSDEEELLVAEERRLADRRAALRETMRLLEEDERLRAEQEAVQQRLKELRSGS